MIRAAATLYATRGMAATSFSDVVAKSGAPRGSIYHHFPDGKTQLTDDALRYISERVLAHIRAGTERTPKGVLARFVELWRGIAVASHGTSGCAVAAVAIDSGPDDADLAASVREIFRSWIAQLADRLHATGLPAARARSIAVTALAAMEGALILSRAEGGDDPFDGITKELMRLV
ncbi:MAG: TetR/AcrR family transcriptional regulator [Candidatus Eremiobacteraeota bacterium]|nr:TetR/AcrR family transcriptional regulator [Candidatus Eremiobacteraeota bacterium]